MRSPSFVWDAVKSLKQNYPSVEVFVKMTVQKSNFFEAEAVLQDCLRRDWVDAFGYSVVDLSGNAFAHSSANPAQYSDRVLLNESECDEFERLAHLIYDRYSDLFASGYIFEGDLLRFVRRFKSQIGLAVPPPIRHCLIPHHNLVIYPDGRLAGCYFLQPDATVVGAEGISPTTIDEVLASREAFESVRTPTCTRCDQLLFTNSPYERPRT
jgi:hypothetical protein